MNRYYKSPFADDDPKPNERKIISADLRVINGGIDERVPKEPIVDTLSPRASWQRPLIVMAIAALAFGAAVWLRGG